jgi:hypothetical protein
VWEVDLVDRIARLIEQAAPLQLDLAQVGRDHREVFSR